VAYAHVIPDYRSGSDSERGKASASAEGEDNPPPIVETNKKEKNLSDFFQDSQGPNIILDDDSERLAATNPQSELLRWQQRLGHTSFAKLKLRSDLVILPRRPSSVQPPKCAGCIYGAMIKRPWRTKASPCQLKIIVATGTVYCVSVDQPESNTPGFVAQLKGTLTKRRYTCATVFLYQHSIL
jgi:hypothetical protein